MAEYPNQFEAIRLTFIDNHWNVTFNKSFTFELPIKQSQKDWINIQTDDYEKWKQTKVPSDEFEPSYFLWHGQRQIEYYATKKSEKKYKDLIKPVESYLKLLKTAKEFRPLIDYIADEKDEESPQKLIQLAKTWNMKQILQFLAFFGVRWRAKQNIQYYYKKLVNHVYCARESSLKDGEFGAQHSVGDRRYRPQAYTDELQQNWIEQANILIKQKNPENTSCVWSTDSNPMIPPPQTPINQIQKQKTYDTPENTAYKLKQQKMQRNNDKMNEEKKYEKNSGTASSASDSGTPNTTPSQTKSPSFHSGSAAENAKMTDPFSVHVMADNDLYAATYEITAGGQNDSALSKDQLNARIRALKKCSIPSTL